MSDDDGVSNTDAIVVNSSCTSQTGNCAAYRCRTISTDWYLPAKNEMQTVIFALWALDKHMWAKMTTCVPQNEEGKRIFEISIAQYNKVNTDGVTYRLNGQTITEKHFDFENTIIKELQTQVDSINAPGAKNWDALDNQWREGDGKLSVQTIWHQGID